MDPAPPSAGAHPGKPPPRPLPASLHALAVLLLAVVASWPALPLLLSGEAILGHPVSDAADHYWGLAWVHRGLLAGSWPTVAEGLFHPEARTLWHADPVGAVLSLPLAPLGPARAWNGLVLLQLVLLGGASWGLGRDLGGTRQAGLVAASVALGAPFLGGLLHSGLSEYFGLAPVVLGVWALLRASGRDPWGRPGTPRLALLAGLALGLAGWQAPYYVLFLGLFALSCLPGSGWRGRLPHLGGALALGALLTLPHALILRRLVGQADSAVRGETAPGWAYARLPGTDLLGFVLPGGYVHPDTPALGNPGILHVVSLGLVALVLAGLALRHRPTRQVLGLPVLLSAVAMLGPRLVVAHRDLALLGQELPLPLALLYLPGSPFREVHHPYRLVALAVPLLALLGALLLARAPRGRALGLAGLVFVEGLLLHGAPWPIATMAVVPPDLYATLPEGAVLDWPADGTRGNRRHTAWQVSHGHPVPYGLNEFLPQGLRADPLVRGLLQTLDEPADRARNRDHPAAGPVVPRRASTETSQLHAWGYRSVVVHPELLDDDELRRATALLRATLGEPREEGERMVFVVTAEALRLPGGR